MQRNKSDAFLPVSSWLLLVLIMMLTACTSQTVTTVAPVEVQSNTATVVEAQPTETATPLPPSATPTLEPSPTLTETPVPPTPTETPTPLPTLGLEPEGIVGWCLAEGAAVPSVSDQAPADAKPIMWVEGAIEAYNLPGSSCTIVFTFNQTMTPEMLQGIKLQVFDASGSSPWLDLPLQPLESRPNAGAVVITHSYFVAPSWWDMTYNISLQTSTGSLLGPVPAHLHRWKPEKCWNGNYPNINTLRCPLPEDLHPWDAGYGTPIPTRTPDD